MWTNFIPVCVILLHKDSDFKNCSWLISKKVYAGSYSLLYAKFQFNLLPKIFQLYHGRNKLHFNKMMISTLNLTNVVRDRPFNLKGGGYGFLFRSEIFFWTTQELEYLFFCHTKCEFFFQNLTLGYMTKTLNQIIFFFLHQNQNIFFSNIGNQNIFLEKNHNPPLFKLNGRSLSVRPVAPLWHIILILSQLLFALVP